MAIDSPVKTEAKELILNCLWILSVGEYSATPTEEKESV